MSPLKAEIFSGWQQKSGRFGVGEGLDASLMDLKMEGPCEKEYDGPRSKDQTPPDSQPGNENLRPTTSGI